jgi:hypothetical protein
MPSSDAYRYHNLPLPDHNSGASDVQQKIATELTTIQTQEKLKALTPMISPLSHLSQIDSSAVDPKHAIIDMGMIESQTMSDQRTLQITMDAVRDQDQAFNVLPDKRRAWANCSGYAHRMMMSRFGGSFPYQIGLIDMPGTPFGKKSWETSITPDDIIRRQTIAEAREISHRIDEYQRYTQKDIADTYRDISDQVSISQPSIVFDENQIRKIRTFVSTSQQSDAKYGLIELHNTKTNNRSKVQADQDKWLKVDPCTHTALVLGKKQITYTITQDIVKQHPDWTIRDYVADQIQKKLSDCHGRDDNHTRLNLMDQMKINLPSDVSLDTPLSTLSAAIDISYTDTIVTHRVDGKSHNTGLMAMMIGGTYTPIKAIQRNPKIVSWLRPKSDTKWLSSDTEAQALFVPPEAFVSRDWPDIKYHKQTDSSGTYTPAYMNDTLKKYIADHYQTIYHITDPSLIKLYTAKTINYLASLMIRQPGTTLRSWDRLIIPNRQYDPTPPSWSENPFKKIDILEQPTVYNSDMTEEDVINLASAYIKPKVSASAKLQIMMLQLAMQQWVAVPDDFYTTTYDDKSYQDPTWLWNSQYPTMTYHKQGCKIWTLGLEWDYIIDGQLWPISTKFLSDIIVKFGYAPITSIGPKQYALFYALYQKYYTHQDKKTGRLLTEWDIVDRRFQFRKSNEKITPLASMLIWYKKNESIYRWLHVKKIVDWLLTYQSQDNTSWTQQSDWSFIQDIIKKDTHFQHMNFTVKNKIVKDYQTMMRQLNILMPAQYDRKDHRPTTNNIIKAMIIASYIMESGWQEWYIWRNNIVESIASKWASTVWPLELNPNIVTKLLFKYTNQQTLQDKWIDTNQLCEKYNIDFDRIDTKTKERKQFIVSQEYEDIVSSIRKLCFDLSESTQFAYLLYIDNMRNENNREKTIEKEKKIIDHTLWYDIDDKPSIFTSYTTQWIGYDGPNEYDFDTKCGTLDCIWYIRMLGIQDKTWKCNFGASTIGSTTYHEILAKDCANISWYISPDMYNDYDQYLKCIKDIHIWDIVGIWHEYNETGSAQLTIQNKTKNISCSHWWVVSKLAYNTAGDITNIYITHSTEIGNQWPVEVPLFGPKWYYDTQCKNNPQKELLYFGTPKDTILNAFGISTSRHAIT